jgi:hypothetical protein
MRRLRPWIAIPQQLQRSLYRNPERSLQYRNPEWQ